MAKPKAKPEQGRETPVARAKRELQTLKPQTKVNVARGLSVRLTFGGIVVPRLHYSAMDSRDPEQHPEWKKSERRKYTSQAAWDREQEIVDEAGGGELVLADILVTYWHKIVVEDPNWRPDYEFKCEGGFDHGKANPAALLRGVSRFRGDHHLRLRVLSAGPRNLAARARHEADEGF